MSQLRDLVEPFPDRFVHDNPSGGGSYVKHHVIVQRLLSVVGPYDFGVIELIRGDVPAIKPNPSGSSKRAREGAPELRSAVVGAVCRLTVTIDDQAVNVEEVGDCEQPHNWPHDGARAKDAMSDAIKRCAARLGLGLHLYSQDEYFLPDLLDKQADRDGVIEHDAEPAQAKPPKAKPSPSSTRRQADDPGADAYPSDDTDRKGANSDHDELRRLVDELATRLYRENVIDQDRYLKAREYARKGPDHAQAAFDRLNTIAEQDAQREQAPGQQELAS